MTPDTEEKKCCYRCRDSYDSNGQPFCNNLVCKCHTKNKVASMTGHVCNSDFYGGCSICIKKTSPTPADWEEEFGKRFKHWSADPFFWEKDIKDFIRTLISSTCNEERQAWLNGERCSYCGSPKKRDPMWSTCDNCD